MRVMTLARQDDRRRGGAHRKHENGDENWHQPTAATAAPRRNTDIRASAHDCHCGTCSSPARVARPRWRATRAGYRQAEPRGSAMPESECPLWTGAGPDIVRASGKAGTYGRFGAVRGSAIVEI